MLEWFAERVDRIILLFDAHKLDISDEFRRAIEALKTYEDKIRIILNKADMINSQQLMRVYGALMWSLGNYTLTSSLLFSHTFRMENGINLGNNHISIRSKSMISSVYALSL